MFLQLSKSVKQSAKVMVWGGMTGGGLTNLHVLPTGQTFTSEYYINQILAKEVKKIVNIVASGDGWPDRKHLVYH